jgi:8-oxo-dGTP pyrophosphatase MutT (NUDIX family)
LLRWHSDESSEDYNRIMTHATTSWPPHMVAATVVEKDGKFLLVYENDGDRKVYNQPAGHWDEGETLQEAAIRETLEETGWQVMLNHIIGQYQYYSPHNQVTYFRTAFAASAIQRVSEKLDKEIIEAVWLTYEEIVARKEQMRSPLVIRVIDDYRAGKKFPLNLVSVVKS